MKFLASIFLFLIIFILTTKNANAIIVVVPAIIIPIVKIAVLIIGAIATPVVGLSALYVKLKNKPVYLGVIAGVIVLIAIALLLVLGMKIVNPDRPFY